MLRDDVVREIYLAIDGANELREETDRLAHSEETVLYGESGLDSLGLVTLILDLEAAIAERNGCRIVLADERAVAQRRNPFRDVASLADHVMARLVESQACPPPPSS